MTEGDEKYKLGELTSDMSAVKNSQAEMKIDIKEVRHDQKEIISKIDSINSVSVERWEKRNKFVDEKFMAHNLRIEALEDINRLRDSSVWTKIGVSFEANFVKFIAAGLLIFALSVAYVYLKNDIIRDNTVSNVNE